MTPDRFNELAKAGFNRIPCSLSVLADLETPLSTYLKLADQPYTYLFESVQGGEKWGRYSIIGLACRQIVRVTGQHISIETEGQETDAFESADPLQWVADLQATYRVAEDPELPQAGGGLVGYFGYDSIGYIEPSLAKLQQENDLIGTPDILLMLSDEVLVFDNFNGQLHVIVYADATQENAFEQAQKRLKSIAEQLVVPLKRRPNVVPRDVSEADFVSGFTETGYKEAVETVREYIAAGDCMQVVLSQRMSMAFKAPPIDLYRALRLLNPSPYMYYLNFGDHHVVGASPEILTRLEEGYATVRPLAGTRKRGANSQEDQALEEELLADEKELAEHLMLIDLGRNDIGRIAETGSVTVTDKMSVERYSHVMHIVSNVVGKLKPGLNSIDVLRAAFPAGTLSGAPKVRAMEILYELEPVKRGVYGGCVGYLGWYGNMDMAIAIRTAVIKDGQLHLQAGAGLVYDSVPDSEWEETMNKGRAVMRAVAMAEGGLDNV